MWKKRVLPKTEVMHDPVVSIAGPLHCQECERPWLDPRERWRIYLWQEARESAVVPYCPDCAQREFDAD